MAAQMALPVDCQPNGSSPVAPPTAPATSTAGVSPTRRPLSATAPPAANAMVPLARASRAERRLTKAAVLVVALVAAVASYDHQRQLAAMAGEGWRSWLLPLSVDGLVVAASMSMLVRRRAGDRSGFLAWVALLGGVGASLAANVAAAEPTLVGRLVAAWPPLALVIAYELLMQQIRVGGGAGVQPSAPHAKQPNTNVDGGEHEQDRVTKS